MTSASTPDKPKPEGPGPGEDAWAFDEDDDNLGRPEVIRRRAYEIWRTSGKIGRPRDYLWRAARQVEAEENSDFIPNPYPLNRDPGEDK